MRDLVYLDSSAIVKLVVREPESAALREFLRECSSRTSSALAAVEVPRSLRRAGYGAREHQRAVDVLARLVLINIDRRILRQAAALAPVTLRNLDAIHLATALSVGEELAGIVAYDERLAHAAGEADIEVWAPA